MIHSIKLDSVISQSASLASVLFRCLEIPECESHLVIWLKRKLFNSSKSCSFQIVMAGNFPSIVII